MNTNNFIILFILVIITICFLAYLNHVNTNGNLNKLINKMAASTKFKPLEFIIYDKASTDTNCNRLIDIMPFGWTLLNTQRRLFILNPERLISCANNTLPAIRVHGDKFIDIICLQYTSDHIEKVYRSGLSDLIQMTIIPFELKPKTKVFTILTAINILLDKKLLLFDLNNENDDNKYNVINNAILNDSNIARLARNDNNGKSWITRKRKNLQRDNKTKIKDEHVAFIKDGKRLKRKKTKYDHLQENWHKMTADEHYDCILSNNILKRDL